MNKTPQLIFEEYQDSSNHNFLTLIEFKKTKYLVIVENIIGDDVLVYVLDHLKAENIDQEWFMNIATKLFYSASEKYPLSLEFARHGKTSEVKKILKTFNISSVSRFVGKLFKYKLTEKPKVKRRKVVPVPEFMEINVKKVKQVTV